MFKVGDRIVKLDFIYDNLKQKRPDDYFTATVIYADSINMHVVFDDFEIDWDDKTEVQTYEQADPKIVLLELYNSPLFRAMGEDSE